MNKWATGWQRTFMLSSGSIVRFTSMVALIRWPEL